MKKVFFLLSLVLVLASFANNSFANDPYEGELEASASTDQYTATAPQGRVGYWEIASQYVAWYAEVTVYGASCTATAARARLIVDSVTEGDVYVEAYDRTSGYSYNEGDFNGDTAGYFGPVTNVYLLATAFNVCVDGGLAESYIYVNW